MMIYRINLFNNSKGREFVEKSFYCTTYPQALMYQSALNTMYVSHGMERCCSVYRTSIESLKTADEEVSIDNDNYGYKIECHINNEYPDSIGYEIKEAFKWSDEYEANIVASVKGAMFYVVEIFITGHSAEEAFENAKEFIDRNLNKIIKE